MWEAADDRWLGGLGTTDVSTGSDDGRAVAGSLRVHDDDEGADDGSGRESF